MSLEFGRILQGLMDNRRLSPRAVSRASARAESTINQLLSGRISPRADHLRDIAPVLEVPLADLLVIAGINTEPAQDRPTPYSNTPGIGQLVAAASLLTSQQVEHLVNLARSLQSQNMEDGAQS